MGRLFNVRRKPINLENRVMLWAFSLLLFHILIRAEILRFSPTDLLHHPSLIGSLLRASLHDLYFIALIALAFLIPLLLIKNNRIMRILYAAFILAAFVSLIAALINIRVVALIGGPFTYQWLYYSDFLGSNEAKSAIGANNPMFLIFNISCILIGFWLFTKALILTLWYIKSGKFYNISLVAFALILIWYGDFELYYWR